MARFEKGILGPFTGTVGTVVGSSWNGISYMRSKSSKRKNASFTTKQLQQQAKFAVMSRVLQSMAGFLMLGFKNYTQGMSGYNSAFGYNIKQIITGNYPAYVVNYALLLLSRGELPNANTPLVQAQAGGIIKFSWGDNTGTGKAAADDKSLLLVYCPAFNYSIYNLDGAARNEQSATLDAGIFKDKEAEVYLAFVNNDETEVSNSLYMGKFMILP